MNASHPRRRLLNPRALTLLCASLALVGCRSRYRPIADFVLEEGGGCAELEPHKGEAPMRYCWGTLTESRAEKPEQVAQLTRPERRGRFTLQGRRLCDTRHDTCAELVTQPSSFSSGPAHACFVQEETVFCVGDASEGRFGDPNLSGEVTEPRRIAELTHVTQITLADRAACALRADGTVSCFGNNDGFTAGQAGPGVFGPSPVVGLFAITRVEAKGDQVCASLTAGGLRCWGRVRGLGASIGRPGLISNVPMPVMFP